LNGILLNVVILQTTDTIEGNVWVGEYTKGAICIRIAIRRVEDDY